MAGEIRLTKDLYLFPKDLWELIRSLGGVKVWLVSVAQGLGVLLMLYGFTGGRTWSR